MLMTVLKPVEEIRKQITGKVFLLVCRGCKEIAFPEEEAAQLEEALRQEGCVTGSLTTHYICEPANLQAALETCGPAAARADAVLVFSCGVGIQTAAAALEEKPVIACCDTLALPGWQGVTPAEHDCGQCGQCYLNLTGGICPVTACSKGLINGQCGGAKDGKCEVDSTMDCGWERIIRRLTQLGRLDALRCPVQVRDYEIRSRSSLNLD